MVEAINAKFPRHGTKSPPPPEGSAHLKPHLTINQSSRESQSERMQVFTDPSESKQASSLARSLGKIALLLTTRACTKCTIYEHSAEC